MKNALAYLIEFDLKDSEMQNTWEKLLVICRNVLYFMRSYIIFYILTANQTFQKMYYITIS